MLDFVSICQKHHNLELFAMELFAISLDKIVLQ